MRVEMRVMHLSMETPTIPPSGYQGHTKGFENYKTQISLGWGIKSTYTALSQ